MSAVDVKYFHANLLMFISCVNPRTAEKLNGSDKYANIYYFVYRKAASYYYRKKIQPYLTLPSIVEMDETYVGFSKFNCVENFPTIRWIFGLHCRSTKLCVMYYIKEKNTENIFNICKKHILPGTTVISDMHSVYVNLA
jgi:hypothetical protein